MIQHLFDSEPKESLPYSPHSRTISDYPLLVGEVLRRRDVRHERRVKRALFTRRTKQFIVGR
jgi:hypothetical protein